ncbi:TIGR01244 family sulfur transferase [Neisseria leonii]|uniref:TIGR01244 family sulfur transferase n=1 Tax=Neisseria leonii TaxID=2995413 RepID=UPI00237B9C1D|nr:TIGR01244 family sulfur transferase [Neisseria sp. 3986]MDD9325577.1 TIGR01244 family sulfur transferase [Neisseria sp. 3986]
MPVYRLSDALYTAPQLDAETVRTAADLGIRSVVCHRPDGEEPDQPSFADIQRLLAAHGIIHSRHQPTAAPHISAADAAAFQALLDELPAPTLAYCRTGTRSSLLWAMTEAAKGRPAEALTAHIAAQSGLNLQPFADRITAVQKG